MIEKQDGTHWKEQRQVVGDAMIADAKKDIAGDATLRLREIHVLEQLTKPQLWLAAAGQIFFSLSVGFGVILCYASYLKKKDDVVLSGLAASSANEFCEVGLGGLITLPAGVAFLGLAGVAGQGTFGLGFNVLPLVFAKMPAGWLFGACFFFMLFLAAITEFAIHASTRDRISGGGHGHRTQGLGGVARVRSPRSAAGSSRGSARTSRRSTRSISGSAPS